jgi:hypothetical protein
MKGKLVIEFSSTEDSGIKPKSDNIGLQDISIKLDEFE